LKLARKSPLLLNVIRNNSVIRKNFLTLLLRVPNNRKEKIPSTKALTRVKAKGKATSRKSAKITHPPGKKITEKRKTYSLLNATIVAK
jgi:hypothetical protein